MDESSKSRIGIWKWWVVEKVGWEKSRKGRKTCEKRGFLFICSSEEAVSDFEVRERASPD